MKKEGNKVNFSIGRIEKIIIVSFIVNTLLIIMKIIAGILGTSGALIADGVHSFSDLTTDIIAIIGNNLAKRPPDYKHPYGYGKAEYITSLIIGILIMLLGFYLMNEMMIGNITTPSLFVIIISLIAMLIKFMLANYLIKKSKQYNNNILTASGEESKVGVIISIIVFISSITMQFANKFKFLIYSDKITGVIVGVFILKVGFDIVKENISMIIGEQVTEKKYLNKINDIILNEKEVKEIKKIVILKYGPYFKLNGEILMKQTLSLTEANDIIKSIENDLKKFDNKINYIMISIRPYM